MSHRRFADDTLVIASHNAGKVCEINELVSPFGVRAVSAAEIGLPEPEETGSTFEANAELKALAAARAAGRPALADDSGLAVTALDGAPGIYSARWAGEPRDFSAAMERVRHEMEAREARGRSADRSAKFICVLTLAWPDGHLETFRGEVAGTLSWPPRGARGFGYDPIFIAAGETETFGEMEPARKHAMSHRAHAFRLLVEACFAPAPAAARE